MQSEIIVGTARRRYWSDAEKVSILEEVGVYGASVSDVARRHDLTRQHLYQWRAQLRRKGLLPEVCGETVFVALPEPTGAPQEALSVDGRDDRIEIVLSKGRRLKCSGHLADTTLLRLIRLVEAA
jgi:transposase